MTLEDDIDLSRGDMLARPNNQPSKSKLLDAKICWLSETPLNLGTKYILGTRRARASRASPKSTMRSTSTPFTGWKGSQKFR